MLSLPLTGNSAGQFVPSGDVLEASDLSRDVSNSKRTKTAAPMPAATIMSTDGFFEVELLVDGLVRKPVGPESADRELAEPDDVSASASHRGVPAP